MNEIVKRAGNDLRDMEVFDDESGKFVVRSAETQRESHHLHNVMQMMGLLKGMILLKFQDEKRYLDFGVSNMEDYCEQLLDERYRTVQRHIARARKVLGIVGGGLDLKAIPESVQQAAAQVMQQVDPGIAGSIDTNAVAALSMFKPSTWDALTRADDDEIANLLVNDKFTGKDGKVYTVRELREMTIRDVRAKCWDERKEEIKSYKKRLQVTDSQIDLLRAENDQLKKQMAHWEKVGQRGAELERQYGPKASTLEQKLKYLEEGMKHVAQARALIVNCGITTDDPASAIVKLRNALADVQALRDYVIMEFAEIAISISDDLGYIDTDDSRLKHLKRLQEIDDIKITHAPNEFDTPEVEAKLKAALEEQERVRREGYRIAAEKRSKIAAEKRAAKAAQTNGKNDAQ